MLPVSTGYEVAVLQKLPETFALKELIAPKKFPVGQSKNIKDYLPLNEAALMQYLRHVSIVDTYWADVRCLHPDTNEPIQVDLGGLHNAGSQGISSWTSFREISLVEKAAANMRFRRRRLRFVKVQMRIAMELCDLGAAPKNLTCRWGISNHVRGKGTAVTHTNHFNQSSIAFFGSASIMRVTLAGVLCMLV
jgi:hypothetical protein